MNIKNKYFTLDQIAKRCGVKFSTVLNWIYSGKIKTHIHPGFKEQKISANDLAFFFNDLKSEEGNMMDFYAEEIESQQNVLILESDLNVSNQLERFFKRHDYKILKTENGLRGTYLVNNFLPTVIALDLNLKTLDGLDFINFLNTIKLKDKIWIILLSDYNADKVNQSIKLGVDFYLQKPIQYEALEKILKKINSSPRDINIKAA